MPLDQTAAMWRAYLSTFADLLKEAGGNEHSPAGKRLVGASYAPPRSLPLPPPPSPDLPSRTPKGRTPM